jgi:hypothetical protein
MKIKVVILLSVFMILIYTSISCKKKLEPTSSLQQKNISETTRYVSAEKGLFLREEAKTTGKKIVLIPFKEKVDVIEESQTEETIDSISGKWTRVRYKDKEGWAFGGYLVAVMNEQLLDFYSAANSFKGEERKLYLEYLGHYKLALSLRDMASKEALKKFEDTHKQISQISLDKYTDGDGMSFFYAFGSLQYQICTDYLRLKRCNKDSLPKRFSSKEEAIGFLKENIEKKDHTKLSDATGCFLETTCYPCDAGSATYISKDAIQKLFDNGQLSPEYFEEEPFDPETALIMMGKTRVLLSKDSQTKNWYFNHFIDATVDDASIEHCTSPGL